jgi:hypothetical protein
MKYLLFLTISIITSSPIKKNPLALGAIAATAMYNSNGASAFVPGRATFLARPRCVPSVGHLCPTGGNAKIPDNFGLRASSSIGYDPSEMESDFLIDHIDESYSELQERLKNDPEEVQNEYDQVDSVIRLKISSSKRSTTWVLKFTKEDFAVIKGDYDGSIDLDLDTDLATFIQISRGNISPAVYNIIFITLVLWNPG